MIEGKKERDRRKARWELSLNPFVTFCVLLLCVGTLLVWVGLFENRVNPGDGVVTSAIGQMASNVRGFFGK